MTSKFELEDYAFSFSIFGIILLCITTFKSKLSRIPNKRTIFAIGILASILTIIGYVGDLFLESYRGSFPMWADSMGIPLMAVPVMFMALLVWVAINSIGMIGKFNRKVSVFPLNIKNINYWYAFFLFITTIVIIFTTASGYFWQIFPSFLWAYFYLTIMTGRKAIEN